MRVLFLTHRLPYAPNRGDRIRAYYILKALRPYASVTLVSLVHDDDERARVSDLRGLADDVFVARVPGFQRYLEAGRTLPTSRPLTHALLASSEVRPAIAQALSGGPPDVVLAYCSGIAQYALQPPLDAFPLVVDMVDVDSRKWAALADRSAAPMRWIYRRETRTLSAFERRLAARGAGTTVVTERERAALAAIAPQARIIVAPNGVDVENFAPIRPPAGSADVVFCGVMNYTPNVEAAVWLARDVWPLVRARLPSARLRLVGASPSPQVAALSALPNVEVTGTVPDVRPYLWDAAVAVAPLHTARGIQNKVLEAIAAGLPTVVTPVVSEGLPPDVLRACRVAADARGFADHLIELLELRPADRRAIAASANLDGLAWDRCLQPLVDLLIDAAGKTACQPSIP